MISPIQKAAVLSNSVEYFIDNDVNKNNIDEIYSLAIIKKKKKLVDYFVKSGWVLENSFTIRGSVNKTDNVDYLRWLDNRGIDVFHGSGIVLFDAAMKGNINIFKEMYSQIDERVKGFNKSMMFINLVYLYDKRGKSKDVSKKVNFENVLEMVLMMTKDIDLVKLEECLSNINNPSFKALVMSEYLLSTINKENINDKKMNKKLKL